MSCFVDTNILIYPRDAAEPEKAAKATALLVALAARNKLILSRQSLNEFYHLVTRKFRAIPISEVRQAYGAFETLASAPSGGAEVRRAWAIQDRYRLGFFDSVLIASALASGATLFVSEDLQHESRIEGLTILDPFRIALSELLQRI